MKAIQLLNDYRGKLLELSGSKPIDTSDIDEAIAELENREYNITKDEFNRDYINKSFEHIKNKLELEDFNELEPMYKQSLNYAFYMFESMLSKAVDLPKGVEPHEYSDYKFYSR